MRLNLDYNIPLKNLLTTVITIPIFLFFFDSLVNSYSHDIPNKIRVLFDITLEANIPTWYSSVIALFVGLTGLLIVQHYYRLKQTSKIIIWSIISLFFIYMSMDDTSQFHERIATAWANYANSTNDTLSSTLAGNFESYYWQLLFLPIFGLIGFVMLYVIKTEFKNALAKKLFIAGLSCFVIAVGLDYIDGVDRYYDFVIQNTSIQFKALEHLSRAVEEMIEMIGLGLIFTSLLLHRESLYE